LAGFPQTGPSSSKPTVNFVSGSVLRKRSGGYDEPAGSAARFFYCAKASKKDRDEGLDGFEERERPTMGSGIGGQPNQKLQNNRNHHPTVKPTELMRYLCRLVTPPNGVILDPFLGSGSTGKAAIYEGFQFVGFDLSAEYVEISRARIEYAMQKRNEISKQKENTFFED
jgi:site-specific DNA-methyltransferase (adenine-specific)